MSKAQAKPEPGMGKGLLELQQRAGNSLEFIENLKIDLFPDEVYVFTPKGRILELPQRASPVDFAYAVHTDIGNTCVACRVDRRLAPLSVQLQGSQTVEIITSEDARPNPDWLSFVVTGRPAPPFAMRSSISRSPSPGPSGDASLTAAWQTSIPISQTFPASAFPTSLMSSASTPWTICSKTSAWVTAWPMSSPSTLPRAAAKRPP